MCHYEAVGLVLCFALPFGVNNESTLTKIYNVARVSVCTILLLEPSKLSFVLDYILVVVLLDLGNVCLSYVMMCFCPRLF